MIISLGCDHGGYELKEIIKKHLEEKNIEYKDFGTYSEKYVDYPEYALKVAESIKSGESDLGILCCGTGIGISIAANKVPGIRAAVVGRCIFSKSLQRTQQCKHNMPWRKGNRPRTCFNDSRLMA